MARIRTIKPEFWDDLKIGRLPRDVRLLYIGLWTFADDLGVVISDPVWLKSKIFPYDQIQKQQFEGWLEMLEKTGFICLVTVESETFIYLPTFSRHQKIDRPNTGNVNIRKEVLDKALALKKSERKSFGDDSTNIRRTFDEPSPTIIGEDKESNIPPIIPPRGDKEPAGACSGLKAEARKEKVARKRKEIDTSAVEPSFQPIVADWLAYKSERGQTYRQLGFDRFYKRLCKLSDYSADMARMIVDYSMANNYAGIFALKERDSYETTSKNDAPGGDKLASAVANGIARAATRQEWE